MPLNFSSFCGSKCGLGCRERERENVCGIVNGSNMSVSELNIIRKVRKVLYDFGTHIFRRIFA